jgi:bromodomain adjacent to zinc finger domain protein 1A
VISGKSNLTYEEAIESEKSARKRLGKIPKALKQGLVWAAHHTQRGRFADMADDVYIFASGRYFVGEIVEAIVNDQVQRSKTLFSDALAKVFVRSKLFSLV